MNVHENTNDIVLIYVGMITGIFGLNLTEIDVLAGIVLKFVSIISFIILGAYNIKKYRHLGKKNKDKDERVV